MMKAKALAIAIVVAGGASLLAASPNARAFQLFDRADVEATFHASGPASVLLWSLGRGNGGPAQPPPIATFLSVSPRVIIGSTLTEDGAHYCAEDWLALFTPDIVFSENQSPSPNQLPSDNPYVLILDDGLVLNAENLPYQPFPLFDDGFFPNVWARLIGTITAPAVDDGEPIGHYPILEIGAHTLTLMNDGEEVETITFVVDGPESDTCNSFCRGMNLPEGCL